MFADASEDTMCAVAYLRSQPKEYSADLAFVIGTPTGIASGSHGSEVERTDSQGT